MQQVLRPYLTAAVAVAGASLVAITPMAPHAPDIQQHAVQLVSDTDPAAVWTQFFETTQNNLTQLNELMAANPDPILTQIIANQTASSEELNTAAQTAFQGLNDYFSGTGDFSFSGELQQGIDAINNGDATTGFGQIYDAFLVFPGLQILPLITQIGDSTDAQFSELSAGVTAFFNGLFGPVLGLIDAGFSQSKAFGSVVDDLSAAMQSGDVQEYFNTLLAAPAIITGGLLNGFDPDSGLLSQGGLGFFDAWYNLQVAIAEAITPPAAGDVVADALAGLSPTDLLAI